MAGFREIQYRLRPRPRQVPNLLPFAIVRAAPQARVETSVAQPEDDGTLWRTIDVLADPASLVKAREAWEAYRPENAVERTVLAAGPTRLVVWYKYRPTGNPSGFSNTALAFQHLGREAVVSDTTQGDEMVVRVLARAGPGLKTFLEAVATAAAPVFDFELDYAGPPRLPARGGLTAAEDRVLRLAVAAGWFDVPRRVSIQELAQRAGVSPSTASARLRSATGKVAAGWAGRP